VELSTRVKGMLCAAGISLLALTAGCTNNDGGSPEPQGGGRDSEAADDPIDSAYDEALESIRCTARQNPLEDCDRDGVSNAADVRPGVDDLADDDGDSITNRRDKYPGLDDRRFDIDQDGLADYLIPFSVTTSQTLMAMAGSIVLTCSHMPLPHWGCLLLYHPRTSQPKV